MSQKVKSIPDGFHSITPYLSVNNAAKAIQFYKEAFGAKEKEKLNSQDGRIMHASLIIGDSFIMLADEFPEYCGGIAAPQTLKGSSVSLHLYVENVDAAFEKAIKAGAKVIMPLEDTFWGDRYGRLEDPFGHQWALATHIKDLTSEQVRKNAQDCGCQ